MRKNENELAFPLSVAYPNDTILTSNGLTKLELISAMCLQGMWANEDMTEIYSELTMPKMAIKCAKELLKQLEAENE